MIFHWNRTEMVGNTRELSTVPSLFFEQLNHSYFQMWPVSVSSKKTSGASLVVPLTV